MRKKRFKDYLNKRLLCIFILGFASGLPLALILGSLQAWYTISGVDIVTIGFLSLISQPYSYKFVWAPLLDRYIPPFLGRRRGWILVTQFFIILTIIFMSVLSPNKNPVLLAILGFVLAFCSASFDISFDAYRTEVLPDDERGIGAALSVEGYRLAMLTSGAFAMILADRIGWNLTYFIMALLMLVTTIATFLAPNTESCNLEKKNIFSTIKLAFFDFFKRDKVLLLLGLIICYKLGDVFSHALTTTFLLKKIAFSQTEVGVINKVVGLTASLLGIFFGGVLMTKLKLFRSLFLFGILQAITNLLYMMLAIIGRNYLFAVFAVFTENLCGGMGTAAFVALIMSLCNKKFTATQFALLSSLAVLGRVYVGPMSGILVKNYGWTNFYFLSFVFALPGLMFLFLLRRNIGKKKEDNDVDNMEGALAS